MSTISGPMTPAQLAAVGTPLTGATKLYRSKAFAKTMLLKQVASLQEAIDCGGVMLYDATSGSTLSFCGHALRQWLASGVLVPKVVTEVGYALEGPGEKSGSSVTGKGDVLDVVAYNRYHLVDASLTVAFCGIVTTVETGFASSHMFKAPFGDEPMLSMQLPGTVTTVAGTPVVIDGVTMFAMDALTHEVAFFVHQIPAFASVRTVLDKVRPYIVEGDGKKYLEQAWTELVLPLKDYVPAMRALVFVRDGIVYHGPGGKREVLAPWAEALAYRKIRSDSAITTAVAAATHLGLSTTYQKAVFPVSSLTASVSPTTLGEQGSYPGGGRVMTIAPLAPCPGAVTLPALVTGKYTAFIGLGYETGASGNWVNRLLSGGLAMSFPTQWDTISAAHTAALKQFGAAPVVALVDLGEQRMPSMVGTMNLARLAVSAFPAVYLADDGKLREQLGARNWGDFLLKAAPETTVADRVYTTGADSQVDAANCVALAKRGLPTATTLGFAWQAWGNDIFDVIESVSNQVYDRALALASEENK